MQTFEIGCIVPRSAFQPHGRTSQGAVQVHNTEHWSSWYLPFHHEQVRVGSLSDPLGLDGLAHFTEHMLFYGSERYPEEDAYSK